MLMSFQNVFPISLNFRLIKITLNYLTMMFLVQALSVMVTTVSRLCCCLVTLSHKPSMALLTRGIAMVQHCHYQKASHGQGYASISGVRAFGQEVAETD